MERKFGERIAGSILAADDEGEGQHDKSRQYRGMERPYARDAPPPEVGNCRRLAAGQSGTIGEPEHEAREHEEEVDREIALGKGIDRGCRQQPGQREADVIEHHQPGRDPAHPGQGFKAQGLPCHRGKPDGRPGASAGSSLRAAEAFCASVCHCEGGARRRDT